MKKRLCLIFFLTSILTGLNFNLAEALETPYHSLDLNSYEEVVRALKRPEWLANYSRLEFRYVSDEELFGKVEYRQSAREMFFRKKGDCEDYAAFYQAVLELHGYHPEVYSIWVPSMGNFAHAVVIFPYRGGWARIENNYYLITGYQSKDKVLKSFVSPSECEDLWVWPLDLPENNYSQIKPKSFIGEERIALDGHLSECEPGFYFYFPTFGYSQKLHKEAIGYLWKVSFNSWRIESIGLGVSAHGFYAEIDDPKDYVYSLYLKWPRIGMSIYSGDYTGIDIDFEIFSGSLINSYLALRNFGEVIDAKIRIFPQSWLEIELEKKDKEFNWITWLKGSLGREKIKIGIERNGFQIGTESVLIGAKREETQLKAFISIQGI